MSEVLVTSIVWIVMGTVWHYFADKRAYREGMIDAVVMHNRGQLIYTTYTDEDGEEIITMEVQPNE